MNLSKEVSVPEGVPTACNTRNLNLKQRRIETAGGLIGDIKNVSFGKGWGYYFLSFPPVLGLDSWSSSFHPQAPIYIQYLVRESVYTTTTFCILWVCTCAKHIMTD